MKAKKSKSIAREESYRRCLYEAEIKCLLGELETLGAMAENLQSAIGSDVRLQLAPKNDQLANAVARIVECEKKIADRVTEYMSQRQNLSEGIAAHKDPEQRAILSMRYLEGKKWKEISEELFISESKALKVHTKALKTFSPAG